MFLSYYNERGEVITGRPIRTSGTFLICESTSKDSNGLESMVVSTIDAMSATDQSRFWQFYAALGGEPLYDEDGNEIAM